MPRRLPAASLALVVLAALAAPAARACLWDYDTMKDERRGLPGIAEVLAGRWERHSAFFYADRVRRMEALIARQPNDWAAYDNLAVALEKLGRVDEAIAVMRRKDGLNPGQYTTHANLGTFHLHKGELDAGIDHVRRALAINPDAHFGREEYQLKVAEFLRAGRDDPRLLTEMNFLEHAAGARAYRPPDTAPSGDAATRPTTEPAARRSGPWFDEHRRRGGPEFEPKFKLKPNVFDGVVGIIRFGTGRSAELYLALGDLLAARGDKHLAYRAYLRALDLNHPRADYLREAMEELRHHVTDADETMTPAVVAAERAAAERWVADYQAFEDQLIRDGKDPDVEANLAPFYAAHGPAVAAVPWEVADLLPRDPGLRLVTVAGGTLAVAVGGCFAAAVIVVHRRRRRQRQLGIAAAGTTAPRTSA